jgi:hypothetical protein
LSDFIRDCKALERFRERSVFCAYSQLRLAASEDVMTGTLARITTAATLHFRWPRSRCRRNFSGDSGIDRWTATETGTRLKSGNVGCPIMTRGVCPNAMEFGPTRPHGHALPGACALAPSKPASWAYARPRKPLSFAPVQGHMGNVGSTLIGIGGAAFRLANASTGRQGKPDHGVPHARFESTDDGFRLISSFRRLGQPRAAAVLGHRAIGRVTLSRIGPTMFAFGGPTA